MLTLLTVNVLFITGIFLSFKLWTSDRLFPLFPIFETISTFPHWLNYIIIALLVTGLLLNQLLKTKKVFLLIFGLLIFLFLQDQMRWQAWVYTYVLMLLPFAIPIKSKEQQLSLLKCLQLLIVGIYLWSGIHKINPAFIDVTFKSILVDFFMVSDANLIKQLRYFGYIVPGLEILTGVLLVSRRYRKPGVALATITHLFILAYLGPLGVGHNMIVYPWNIGMILFSWLLFYGQVNKLNLKPGKGTTLKIVTIGMYLLVLVLPALNFFGYWDHYLSFSLYSDKPKNFYVAVAETEIHRVDPVLKPYFMEIKGMQGGEVIDINKWSLDQLNVPFYPEKRLFEKMGESFCELGIPNDKMVFLVFERPIAKGSYESFSCQDLKKN